MTLFKDDPQGSENLDPRDVILRNLQLQHEALMELLAGNMSVMRTLEQTALQNRRLLQELGVELPRADPGYSGVINYVGLLGRRGRDQ